jgi:hypothetical protein
MSQPGEGIKVVDAEPQVPASQQQNAINPNALFNNAMDGVANLGSRFNPFAQKLGKGFGQVRQVTNNYNIYI